MIKLLVFALFTTLLQDSQHSRVDRVFVTTPYNASIIYEYANGIIPEEKEFTEGLVDCFVSRLKATGLFRDVQIKITTTEEGRRANIEVIPEWDQAIESFEIGELIFEGFNNSDHVVLRQYLRKHGVKAGVRLFQYPLSRVRAMVIEAAQKISESDPEREEQLEWLGKNLYFDLKVVAPRKVQLKVGLDKPLPCQ